MKVMIDGQTFAFETFDEFVAERRLAPTTEEPSSGVTEELAYWKTLESGPANHNLDMKKILTSELDEDGARAFAAALKTSIPSIDSPEPVFVSEPDYTSPALRETAAFFEVAYQASNFLSNGNRFRWANGEFGPLTHAMAWELAVNVPGGDKLPILSSRAPKIYNYNASYLVSKEEAQKIFKGYSPDQLAYEVAFISGLWGDTTTSTLKSQLIAGQMIGDDRMPSHLRGSAAHYAMAIGLGVLEHERSPAHARAAASKVGRNFLSYLEEDLLPKKGFSNEKEAADWLLSNPDELDDFMWRPEALDWLVDMRSKDIVHQSSPISSKDIKRLKDVQERIIQFTNLLDERWKVFYEKSGMDALRSRFGHPVGIPTAALKHWHFLFGGYLIESGWMSILQGDGTSPRFQMHIPVDSNGKPDPSTGAWENLSPKACVRSTSTLSGLGDLAEACATAVEGWHIAYNRGLPRDSLYMGAALAVTNSNLNGTSQDDYSGTVRGVYHPILKGFELIVGRDILCYPTARSKIQAVSREYSDQRICPRGVISLKEIDLANWRLTRLSDNFCGNEYGVNTVRAGMRAPYNFTRLGRSYHEEIQDKIRSYECRDGIATFAEQNPELVRPLAGVQRGEAARMFIERPGTYLRRVGLGSESFGGVSRAIFEHIRFPLSPCSVFRDVATGLVTDGTLTTSPLPGTLSLHPLSFCASGSGSIKVDGQTKWFPVETFNKFISIGPGRRGENFPRRLRFAATSLGETASKSGLIHPGIDATNARDFLEVIPNLHAHVAEPALRTKDAPRYAEVLTKAPWHSPDLWVRDYEMGEMGEAYRFHSTSEEERRLLLQAFLSGKQAERHRMCLPGMKGLSAVEAYFRPTDSRLMFGFLLNTGPMLDADPQRADKLLSPGRFGRDIGIDRGVGIYPRPVGSFFAALREPNDDPSKSHCRKDDKVKPLLTGFLATRGGYMFTGLEDTPILFDETRPPKDWAPFVDEWSKLVVVKGMAGEYEPYYYEEVQQKVGLSFHKMQQKMMEMLGKNQHFLNVALARTAFAHVTRYQGFETHFEAHLTQVAIDEAMMLSAHDAESLMRVEYKVYIDPILSNTQLNDMNALLIQARMNKHRSKRNKKHERSA